MAVRKVLPTRSLALFVVLILGVLGLVGCSQSKAGNQSVAQEAPVSDSKASDSTTDEGPVWVLVKETTTYKEDEFETSYVVTYELDEHGNTMSATHDSGGGEPYVTTYEFDEDGFVTKYTETGYETATVTNTLKKDDQGREVKCTSDDGSTIETTYGANGHVKSRVFCTPTKAEDEEGNMVDSGTYTTTVNYGEDGFVTDGVTTSTDHGSASFGYAYTKTYERDADGKATGMTTTTFQIDENGNPVDETATTTTSKLEYDENGNLVRVTGEGTGHDAITEYEYVKVEDPSLYVRLESHLKYL